MMERQRVPSDLVLIAKGRRGGPLPQPRSADARLGGISESMNYQSSGRAKAWPRCRRCWPRRRPKVSTGVRAGGWFQARHTS